MYAPSLDNLLLSANRQLNICNSCRYCEGLCAVFPALERRIELGSGDITQLANLCHDCRACLDACMYAPPHEFELNIPRILSEVRVESYAAYVWPRRLPELLQGWRGALTGMVISSAVVFITAFASTGFSGLHERQGRAGSPYDDVPYYPLLTLLLVTSLFSVAVIFVAARRFWREINGRSTLARPAALWRATIESLTLRYLRGGGGGCFYPSATVPSPTRRVLHTLVAYGFGLCLVSTTSAAVLQDFLGSMPPYDVVSAPVISGLVGGIAMTIGCTGLLAVKASAAGAAASPEMTRKDYGLLVALDFLAISGLMTLFVRSSGAFDVVFIVHLAAILFCFVATPYSKFVHVIYRYLSLVKNQIEQTSSAEPELAQV